LVQRLRLRLGQPVLHWRKPNRLMHQKNFKICAAMILELDMPKI
jgi:hypothetical protein